MEKTIGNGLREPMIGGPDQQADIRFCLLQFVDDADGAIRGVVIDDQDLTVERTFREDLINFADDLPDIRLFIEGGDNHRQVVHAT